MKRSNISRKTPLTRTGAGWPRVPAPVRQVSLAKVSKKRQRENRERTEVLRPLREAQPWCARCGKTGVGLDAHELLSRAQGGSTTDLNNIVLLDRDCHRFITENPKVAAEEGWAISRKWDAA